MYLRDMSTCSRKHVATSKEPIGSHEGPQLD